MACEKCNGTGFVRVEYGSFVVCDCQKFSAPAPPSSKVFIGLGHKARHGKNFVADTIHHAYPALTRVLGFADALKAHCRVAFGMRKKDAPLLQMVGTDLYRRQNPNIWVEVLEATAQECDEPVIVIPDVRFPNEAEFVRSRGGVVVKVVRVMPDGRPYVAPDRDPNHASETALDHYEWDLALSAPDGATNDLRTAALGMFEHICVEKRLYIGKKAA